MKVISSLDLGTSKVVSLVGEIDSYGEIQIIGVGEAPSRGIDRGYITKLDLAVKSIMSATREAQDMATSKIEEVFVSISSPTLKSQNERDTLSVSPQPVEIEQTHIDRLIERALTRAREEGYEVISAVPRKFSLDEQEGIISPVGLLGSRLSAEIHVVKVGSSLLRNLEKAVFSSGINIAGKFLSPMASAEAVLSPEEKEEGVLLIDMGAGLTDFVLYQEGSPLITGSVPMGGINITKDIAHFLKITVEQAEMVKIEHGFAIADLVSETERIKIKPRGEEKETTIGRRQLAEVIQIRLEEIMDKLMENLEARGISLESVNAGVVITGGCAKLQGMRDFLERYFDMPARIGYPVGVVGLTEKAKDPAYSTAVGLIKLAHQERIRVESLPEKKVYSKNSNINSLWEKIKAFFRDII